MISWVAFLALASGPRVVEVPDPRAHTVVVEAFVPAPPNMSDKEAAAWRVLAEALYDGSEEFSRDRLIQYGSQAGVPLSIQAFTDFIKIQVVEPKGGLKVASQIVESLCLRATLTDEAITEAVHALTSRNPGVWNEALDDLNLAYDKVTFEQVRNDYAQAFRTENLTLVFGGQIESGEGTAQVKERFAEPSSKPPRRTRWDFAPRSRLRHLAPVTTFELRASPLTLTQATDADRLLAVFALGVGKSGAMHRVLREAMGLTYRQEAVLWPTTTGWLPRFVFARKASDQELGLAVTAKDALLKDVDTWDEGTLTRAKAMAASSLSGDNPLCPFWTGSTGPYSYSVEDRCSWAGLTLMMTGASIDPATVVQALSKGDLDGMKMAARTLLDQAQFQVIPGSS